MELHYWIIFAWIALPTVMFGGASLLRMVERGNVLTPVQLASFRAGHAHAGVLLLMSLLYYLCMSETGLLPLAKYSGCTFIVLAYWHNRVAFLSGWLRPIGAWAQR
jgi:hypothetical protein